jgi:phosphoglycerate dehydrogenase-like enzyme/predicted dehydrogenase
MPDQAPPIPSSSRCPRALVVGASETAALLHLPVLAQLRDAGRIELVEICDLRPGAAEEARRRFGFARDSGDAAAAIHRSDIDLVYLFGKAQLHHTLGLAALGAGKHLFIEKPIAPGYAEACALADAARPGGLVAVGGHNRRFLAALARLRALAGSGGWTYAEAVFHKPEQGRPPPFGAASWLTANGIHALDALIYMMGGLPDHVSAQASGWGVVPGTFSALMRWPGNAQAVFLCDNAAGERREDYSFHAPGESWRVTEAGLIGRRDGGPLMELGLSPVGDGFAAEHDAFLAAVAGGPPPPNTIAALAPSLFLAELIEAGHHGPVRLPERRTTVRLTARHTVLLVGADRLRATLGAMPAAWRLISPADLDRSVTPHADVVAAILGQGAEPLSEAMLDRLPNLAVVGAVGLSLARLAPDRLLARGITLVNASHAYAESVAEFAFGLAVLGRRRAFVANRAMQRGGWGTALPQGGVRGALLRGARRMQPIVAALGLEQILRRAWRSRRVSASLPPSAVSSRDLAGAQVGLIGWGANARAFARRLIAAEARVIVYSDHAAAAEIRAAGAEPASLAAVLAADIVSLHRGLTPATHHCLGAAELDRLRPGAVLINVARGALIEPSALVARLRRGDITACLDTFEQEPLPRRHPLRRLPNVFLTPHIAGGSPDMHAAAASEVIAKVGAHLDGEPVAAVTADRLATMT